MPGNLFSNDAGNASGNICFGIHIPKDKLYEFTKIEIYYWLRNQKSFSERKEL
jgi:hypothetical protein